MNDEFQNTDQLIAALKARTTGGLVTSGTVALLNVIPYAGGAVASVIGEIAAQRRVEKVCDVLSDLNSRLEQHRISPELYLSKDQIIEVVHDTIRTVATASDEAKIAALKNGLGYAFVSADSFERKQLLLQILRDCTSLELVTLRAVYRISDPFVEEENSPVVSANRVGANAYAGNVMASSVYAAQGAWRAIGNKEECRQHSLLEVLAGEIRFDEGTTEGALRMLDGKGLTSAGPNLMRKDCKVVRWEPLAGSVNVAVAESATVMTSMTVIRPSPLEASRTKLGHDFLNFCTGG